MDEITKKVYEYVKKEFDKADKKNYGKTYFFDYHILPAYNLAMKLGEKYHADKRVVGIAILLHDIGNINLKGNKDHSLAGVEKINKIFKKLKIEDEDLKNQVKKCIRHHETYSGENKEIKIIVTADALSHLTTPFLIKKATMSKKSFFEYIGWCVKKIDTDFKRIPLKNEKRKIRVFYLTLKKFLTSSYYE